MTQAVLSPADARRLRELEAAVRALRSGSGPGAGFVYDAIGRPMLPNGVMGPTGGIRPPGAPLAPTALVLTPGAVAGDVFIDVDWAPPTPGAGDAVTDWAIEWQAAGDALPAALKLHLADAPPYRLHFLKPHTVYTVRVRALTQLGATSLDVNGTATTTYDPSIPAAPTGLAGARTYKGVSYGWTPLGTFAAPFDGRYFATVATDAGFTANVQILDVGSASVAHFDNLPIGVPVYCKVRARSASAVDGPDSATLGPLTPGGVAAAEITAGTLGADVAYIGNLSASQINTGTLDATLARILNLDVGDATVRGQLTVDRLGAGVIGAYLIQVANGGIVRSQNFNNNPGTEAGWQIDGAGNVIANNATFRGVLAAAAFASDDFSFRRPNGHRMLRMFYDGGGEFLAFGDAGSLLHPSGLRWDDTEARYFFEAGDANNAGAPTYTTPAFQFQSNVRATGYFAADGPVVAKGNVMMYENEAAYTGYCVVANGAGDIDKNWGLAVIHPSANAFYSILTYYSIPGEDRRAGLFDQRTGNWVAYANTNAQWVVPSSIEFKTRVRPRDDDAALAAVLAMRPVRYVLKGDEAQLERLSLVAEEAQTASPFVVGLGRHTEDAPETPIALDPLALTVESIGAIRALAKRIRALEAAAGHPAKP